MALTQNSPRIFISYARKDGEEIAKDLRQKLEAHFSLWQDRTEMDGTKKWWDQIVEALKQVEYMVLVMTPEAIKSDVVRKEWRLARQEGVGVLPVIGSEQLDFNAMPSWMCIQHFVDSNNTEEWTRLIRTLESPYHGARVPFMVEDLPDEFVARPDKFSQIKEGLLDQARDEPVAITAALRGAGGYGKTTLAKALCHDEQIQDAFHDGILWVTLGEQPNIMAGLTKLYAALTDERPNFVDEEDASSKLAEIIGEKDCVMVVDDVWNGAHVTPFLRGGKRCARIITTRDSSTLPPNAKLRVDVDAMHQEEALALLAFDLPERESVALQALATELGEWPFLLKLVNGTLRDRVNIMQQSLPAALDYVKKALKKRGLTAFDARDPVERNQAVAITLAASFDHLKEEELARYQELAIFPEDVEIPLTAITKLWGATGGLDDFDTEELCTRLNQLSLVLRYDVTTQRIQLHDVVRTYLEQQVAQRLVALHRAFIDAHKLKDEPAKAAQDTYLCRYLAYHLVNAERRSELKKLLLNIDWLYAKLEAMDVPALLSDFDWVQGDETLALVQCAIRLSAHIVGKDPDQLISQLMGRLLSMKSIQIQKLLHNANCWPKKMWLRPVKVSLVQPGGSLIRTVLVPRSGLNALSLDGTRVITVRFDETLKVWDLTNGQELHTLRGHSDSVTSVNMTHDGRRAISASSDGVIKVWDLVRGDVMQTLQDDNIATVSSVAMTPDGKRAISISSDGTIKVWDLPKKIVVQILRHDHEIGDARIRVTMTRNGRRAVSASEYGQIKVWDLDRGILVHTLQGNAFCYIDMMITPDGTRGIFASWSRKIEVWDLDNGEMLQTLTDDPVSVAITHDGTQAISTTRDGTIKVWDVDRGEVMQTLQHAHDGTDLTVTLDSNMAISVSNDGTCKVWDLSNVEVFQRLHDHRSAVHLVSMTPDGRWAITVSNDGTCKVWDLFNGEIVRTLQVDSDWQTVATVTPDGTLAISTVYDTLKVWDIASGKEVYTLRGHSCRIGFLTMMPDGYRVISTSNDETTKVWDLMSGEEVAPLSQEEIQTLRTYGEHRNRMYLLSKDSTLEVIDPRSGGEKISRFTGESQITAYANSLDSRTIVAGERSGRVHILRLEGID